MSASSRSSEGLDARRRKILFRAWRRGTREMDLIMGRFADACIADLSESALDEFERLLALPDQEVFAWLVGTAAPPPAYDTAVFRQLREFRQTGEL